LYGVGYAALVSRLFRSHPTLRREHSKNGEPRVLPLVGELAEVISRRREAREYQTPTGETVLSVYVFHRDGQQVGDFRKSWKAAAGRLALRPCCSITFAARRCETSTELASRNRWRCR
jgi:hypothetical protein